MTNHAEAGRTWRASPLLRIAFTLLGTGILLCALFVPSTDPDESIAYRFAMAAFAVGCCVVPQYVRVELHADHLRARGILRTRTVALADLQSVEADSQGMVFVLRSGRAVGAPFFVGEKSPIASWLCRRTTSDVMSAEIMAAARRGGDRPGPGTPDGGSPRRRWAAVSGSVQWCSGSFFARSREARISASASSRPTHSAPSTDLPGSRSL